MTLRVVPWIRRIFRELCFCFRRSFAKVKPNLVIFAQVNLNLSRVAQYLLALKFSPSKTLDERIISTG
jgi:hypothetical protein